MTEKQDIAEIQETIVKLQKQVKELSKPTKFEWEYEQFKTFLVAETSIFEGRAGTKHDYLAHGRYRKTEQGAEISLARNRRANRLEALVDQIGEIKEFVYGETNYFIHRNKKWCVGCASISFEPDKVYSTEETMEKVCNLLNSRAVES